MQKRSTCFLVMSAVVAVLATGCASNKGAEAGTSADSDVGTTTAGMEAQQHTAEHNVTDANWAQVDSGPLSVVGVVGVGRFDGEATCYASTGPTCGNPSSVTAGTRVFSCAAGRCAPENGGRVEAGQILCCGSTNGRGGKLRIAYSK